MESIGMDEPQPHVPVACPIKQVVNPKFEGPFKKLVRKVKQAVVPTHASVRWDGLVKAWAVLDGTSKPVRHFDYGYMTNVRFRSESVTEYVGCGPATATHIGIAEGELVENNHGSEIDGFQNLSFKDGSFTDAASQPVTATSYLRLMGNRTSLYRP